MNSLRYPIIALAALALAGGCSARRQSTASYSGTYSGAAESAGGQTTGTAAGSGGVITDPAILTGVSDPSAVTGRQVQLPGLKVRRVLDDRVLELDDGKGKRIYVLSNDFAVRANKGGTVNITGTVKPGTHSDVPSLSGAAAEELSSRPFYVQANKIEIAGQ